MSNSDKLLKIMLAGAFILGGALLPHGEARAEYPFPCEILDENNQAVSWQRLKLDFPFVHYDAITQERQFDLPAKSLLIWFDRPRTVLSTLDGWETGVSAVGNHYNPPEAWGTAHDLGLAQMAEQTKEYLGFSQESACLLFTGADVDKYAYVQLSEEEDGKELRVGVLATAGVKANAMRAGFDSGDYWEPGTINLIILVNRELAPQAMLQMLIVATEAKTAALEDLDIRSTYSATPATGTGTDNIIVVGGEGAASGPSAAPGELSATPLPLTMAGGHTKLGELTGRAVHQAVIEAIEKQNAITAQRSVTERLNERGIDLDKLINQSPKLSLDDKKTLAKEMSLLLEKPYFADFIAAACAVADANERSLAPLNENFIDWCLLAASKAADAPVGKIKFFFFHNQSNPALLYALNALLTGIAQREGIELPED